MLACGSLRVGTTTTGTWQWTDTHTGKRISAVSYRGEWSGSTGTLTLSYALPSGEPGKRKDVTCRLALSSIPLHYGGRRWYLHCDTNRLCS